MTEKEAAQWYPDRKTVTISNGDFAGYSGTVTTTGGHVRTNNGRVEVHVRIGNSGTYWIPADYLW